MQLVMNMVDASTLYGFNNGFLTLTMYLDCRDLDRLSNLQQHLQHRYNFTRALVPTKFRFYTKLIFLTAGAVSDNRQILGLSRDEHIT